MFDRRCNGYEAVGWQAALDNADSYRRDRRKDVLLQENGSHVLRFLCEECCVGRALLKDAMLRTLQAADIAGIRTFAVHAKDEEARRFYLQFDFIPSPADAMHLFILLKDVRRIAGAV